MSGQNQPNASGGNGQAFADPSQLFGGADLLAIERTAHELLEMADRVERSADRPDQRCPPIERKLMTMVAVELLEGEPRRALGVDE